MYFVLIKKTNNFVNIPREKAKSIVNSLNPEYKVVTKNLKHDEYEKIFPKCKIYSSLLVL